jgi:hypothetical protein
MTQKGHLMFTAFDKALAALLGALVYFAGMFGVSLPWLTPEVIQNIAVGVTPILVYLIPNKA